MALTEMLTFFVFYEYLAVAQKRRRLLNSVCLLMDQQRAFRQRNRHRAWAWPLSQCSSLTETWICPFIQNFGTASRAHRAHRAHRF